MELRNQVVSKYSDFRTFRPMTTRERLRYVALSVLSLGNFLRKVKSDSVTFVVFHYLFEENHQDFRKFISKLSADFNFVSVNDGVSMVENGTISGRNLCFTCDDGFANFSLAAEILEEFGATGCLFVCPRLIEINNYTDLAFYNKDRLGGPPVEFLSWDRLGKLKSRGHEIGNHTWSHRNLGLISDSQVEDEISASVESIKVNLGDCEHFACPYGHRDAFTKVAVKTVYELGHKSFFTTLRGIHSLDSIDEFLPEGSAYRLFHRQHFEPYWPVSHSSYFIHQ